MVHAYVPNFVLIGLFCRPLLAKNPNIAIFWTLAFSGITNWQQSEKVERRCTTTNLPLSNGIKIVFVLPCLHGKIGRTALMFKSVTDKQTDTDKTRRPASADRTARRQFQAGLRGDVGL